MKKVIGIFIACVFSCQIFAGNSNNAKISKLMIDRIHGSTVFIKLDKGQQTVLPCHSNTSWHFTLDITDDLGKAIYSALLTNYSTGKAMNFIGAADCSVYPSIEALRRIEIV